MQAADVQQKGIRISINLLHLEGTSEKLVLVYTQISQNKIHFLH